MAFVATRIQEIAFDESEEYRRFCQAAPQHEGAMVMFVGKVRNTHTLNNQEEAIIHLTVEYYPQMAEKLLARLAETIAQEFVLSRLSIIHRIGRIMAGETIIAVLAAAPHRKTCFEACQEIVTRLKTELPFWKKETSTKTSYWITPPASN